MCPSDQKDPLACTESDPTLTDRALLTRGTPRQRAGPDPKRANSGAMAVSLFTLGGITHIRWVSGPALAPHQVRAVHKRGRPNRQNRPSDPPVRASRTPFVAFQRRVTAHRRDPETESRCDGLRIFAKPPCHDRMSRSYTL